MVDLGHQIFADLLRLAGVTEEDRQRIGDVCRLPAPVLKVTPGIKKRIEVVAFLIFKDPDGLPDGTEVA